MESAGPFGTHVGNPGLAFLTDANFAQKPCEHVLDMPMLAPNIQKFEKNKIFTRKKWIIHFHLDEPRTFHGLTYVPLMNLRRSDQSLSQFQRLGLFVFTDFHRARRVGPSSGTCLNSTSTTPRNT